jgi:hypothetical protein
MNDEFAYSHLIDRMRTVHLPRTSIPEAPGDAMTQTVYFGTVFPLSAAAAKPAFVYERLVGERDGALVSTHVTRDPSGSTAIRESARHTADYSLVDYTLHENQLGQTGTIRVDGDRVSFERLEGTKRRARVERVKAPVVVGPTLVGHVVRNLASLRAGEVLRVRLAVLDRLETIGFDLQAVEAAPGQTRIRVKPSSFLVALIVGPLYFTFETATAKLVRLEGRVPPKVRAGDAWRDFDARVEYRFVAEAYR